LGLTLLLCLLASLLKFIVAWQTRSLAVISDAAYSLLALSVHHAALLDIWFNTRSDASDSTHSARKLQTGIVILLSTILALTAWEIIGAAYDRHTSARTDVVFQWTGVIALLCTVMGQTLWFYMIYRFLHNRWSSLVREVGHAQIYATSAALLGLFITMADAILALFTLGLLARSVCRMVYASLSALNEH
jgi:divalent metal cation (Fe/Co/Zn/Cd) transporter